MNSLCRPPRVARHVALAIGLGLFAENQTVAADAKSTPPAPPPPKTHVLFVGADIDLKRGDKYLRVEDVTPGNIVAKGEGQPVKVRIASDVSLRVTEAIKLADRNVAISKFKAQRAYSPDADPLRSMAQAAAFATDAIAMQDMADRGVRNSEARMGMANAQAASAEEPLNAAAWNAVAQAEADNLAAAQNQQAMVGLEGGGVNSMLAGTSLAVNQAAQGAYDAIRVSFDLQPETDLPNPHVALIATIREPTSKPNEVRKWVHVKSLGPISAGDTQRVDVYASGMSPGYVLEHCDVHVYNGTDEFATSLSRRRIEVTDDEAHQFRILAYVSAHQGRTLAPGLVTDSLHREARVRLQPDQLAETFYVRVSKAGKATAVFRDADAKQPVRDAALESVLGELRFNPALEAGKPVEGVAPVKLGSLSQL